MENRKLVLVNQIDSEGLVRPKVFRQWIRSLAVKSWKKTSRWSSEFSLHTDFFKSRRLAYVGEQLVLTATTEEERPDPRVTVCVELEDPRWDLRTWLATETFVVQGKTTGLMIPSWLT